jgi:hypothetical protein
MMKAGSLRKGFYERIQNDHVRNCRGGCHAGFERVSRLESPGRQ